MIGSQDETNYEALNKVYIPLEYTSQNWKYNFNGDYIIIRTNTNCNTQYQNQYCTCYAYNMKNNVISSGYECNYTTTSNQTIPYSTISNNINDSMYIRERYVQDKEIMIGIFILGIILAILLTKRGAYR